jgi:beta-glucosidase
VVQLYVKHLKSRVARPAQELKGFQRVTVGPGETKRVTIALPAGRLAYWDEKSAGFRVEEEPVRVMVGDSSQDLPLSAVLQVR